jgi:succinate dehydrogenase/fumarate reductase-like Fe-S protein
MALTGRALAWLNLAYRFGRHVTLRLPRRALGRRGELGRFLAAVEPEGYTPLTAEERALLPAAMACINCGLCALACASAGARAGTAAMGAVAGGTVPGHAGSAWDDAWTFVAGPSRSLDRAPLVAAGIPACATCDACASVCPTGVPIPRLAALARRMAQPQPLAKP